MELHFGSVSCKDDFYKMNFCFVLLRLLLKKKVVMEKINIYIKCQFSVHVQPEENK